MSLTGGETFAGYTILRLLGRGGMGEVYLAQHPRLPRTDALKVLAADVSSDTGYRARFDLEADRASKLYHPHIVGIHDRGEDNGRLWISMDYVDGLDAAHLLGSRFPNGMPAHRVATIITAVASALDYAHDRGLLHRDVKPANILLTEDAREQRILLADFGIARDVNTASGLTATNCTVGTVAYAAPEQLTGEATSGHADQYALAATAYHLFTGSQLFPHSNAAVIIGCHLNAIPPALGATRPELAHFDAVMATALAKNPADRFTSCSDFARALAAQATVNRDAGTTPTVAAPVPAPYPQPWVNPAPPQNAAALRWPLTIGAIVVLAVLGVLLLAVRLPRHDHDGGAVTGASTSVIAATVAPARPPTSTRAAPEPSAVTFTGMRDFVIGYYGRLPAHPMEAWAQLDTDYQDQSGLDEYLAFWSSIGSVIVLAVSPRDQTSVVAQIQYVYLDGHSQTEDRWLRVVMKDGAMLIYNSDIA